MSLIYTVMFTYARCRCCLHGDTGQNLATLLMKYDNYISKTGGSGATPPPKKKPHINHNERKIDMRQMEQSPLDPENVRSLKHKGSGVSCFKTDHFFPFIMYLPCDLYIVSTGPCIYKLV